MFGQPLHHFISLAFLHFIFFNQFNSCHSLWKNESDSMKNPLNPAANNYSSVSINDTVSVLSDGTGTNISRSDDGNNYTSYKVNTDAENNFGIILSNQCSDDCECDCGPNILDWELYGNISIANIPGDNTTGANQTREYFNYDQLITAPSTTVNTTQSKGVNVDRSVKDYEIIVQPDQEEKKPAGSSINHEFIVEPIPEVNETTGNNYKVNSTEPPLEVLINSTTNLNGQLEKNDTSLIWNTQISNSSISLITTINTTNLNSLTGNKTSYQNTHNASASTTGNNIINSTNTIVISINETDLNKERGNQTAVSRDNVINIPKGEDVETAENDQTRPFTNSNTLFNSSQSFLTSIITPINTGVVKNQTVTKYYDIYSALEGKGKTTGSSQNQTLINHYEMYPIQSHNFNKTTGKVAQTQWFVNGQIVNYTKSISSSFNGPNSSDLGENQTSIKYYQVSPLQTHSFNNTTGNVRTQWVINGQIANSTESILTSGNETELGEIRENQTSIKYSENNSPIQLQGVNKTTGNIRTQWFVNYTKSISSEPESSDLKGNQTSLKYYEVHSPIQIQGFNKTTVETQRFVNGQLINSTKSISSSINGPESSDLKGNQTSLKYYKVHLPPRILGVNKTMGKVETQWFVNGQLINSTNTIQPSVNETELDNLRSKQTLIKYEINSPPQLQGSNKTIGNIQTQWFVNSTKSISSGPESSGLKGNQTSLKYYKVYSPIQIQGFNKTTVETQRFVNGQLINSTKSISSSISGPESSGLKGNQTSLKYYEVHSPIQVQGFNKTTVETQRFVNGQLINSTKSISSSVNKPELGDVNEKQTSIKYSENNSPIQLQGVNKTTGNIQTQWFVNGRIVNSTTSISTGMNGEESNHLKVNGTSMKHYDVYTPLQIQSFNKTIGKVQTQWFVNGQLVNSSKAISSSLSGPKPIDSEKNHTSIKYYEVDSPFQSFNKTIGKVKTQWFVNGQLVNSSKAISSSLNGPKPIDLGKNQTSINHYEVNSPFQTQVFNKTTGNIQTQWFINGQIVNSTKSVLTPVDNKPELGDLKGKQTSIKYSEIYSPLQIQGINKTSGIMQTQWFVNGQIVNSTKSFGTSINDPIISKIQTSKSYNITHEPGISFSNTFSNFNVGNQTNKYGIYWSSNQTDKNTSSNKYSTTHIKNGASNFTPFLNNGTYSTKVVLINSTNYFN